MSYFAADPRWWRTVRETLPKPWARDAVLIDLRWWQDQILAGVERRLPSRSEFRDAWGWTDRRVRDVLAAEDEWTDSKKAAEWSRWARRNRKGPAEVQTTSSGGPAEVQDDPREDSVAEPERSSGGPAEVQTTSSERPQACGSTDTDTDTAQENPPTPLRGEPSLPLRLEESPTVADPTPPWARGHKGVPAIAVLGAVVRAIEAIRQRPVDPERCKADAAEVLRLWKALDRPPLDQFAAEVELVAEWGRESEDHLAANDLRGVRATGERWGADRSRDVATVCRHQRWGDRLEAASAWKRGEHREPVAPLRGWDPSYGTFGGGAAAETPESFRSTPTFATEDEALDFVFGGRSA
jgi:hypothetical protein